VVDMEEKKQIYYNIETHNVEFEDMEE